MPDLRLRDEAIDLWIGCGASVGLDAPASDTFLFGETDCCQRMIKFGKSHCLAKVGAAKDQKKRLQVLNSIEPFRQDERRFTGLALLEGALREVAMVACAELWGLTSSKE